MKTVLLLLGVHVLLSLSLPVPLSPPLSSNHTVPPTMYGIGAGGEAEDDGGCLLIVNETTGDTTCSLSQCPLGIQCEEDKSMYTDYAQPIPGTTQIFQWGEGPCCNTVYQAYLTVDVITKEIKGIFELDPPFSFLAAAPAGPNLLLAADQYAFSEFSTNFEIVKLGLERNNDITPIAKFLNSHITPGQYSAPGMFIDHIRNRVILVGILDNHYDEQMGALFINATDWSVISVVPYANGLDFIPSIAAYDAISDKMVAIDQQDDTVTYLAWKSDEAAPIDNLKTFCPENDECDFTGCTIKPGTTELFCGGSIGDCQAIRSVNWETGVIGHVKPNCAGNANLFSYLAFVQDDQPDIVDPGCGTNKCFVT